MRYPLSNYMTSDPLLSHWTQSSKKNEELFLEVKSFLEDLQPPWLAKEETQRLLHLLERNEIELVDRYIEVQMHLRTSEERNHLHVAIELEKKLENYLKNAQGSDLKKELALRCMEKILNNWLISLGLTSPPTALSLHREHFGANVKRNIAIGLKEEGPRLEWNARIALEDLLQTSEESIEYWNRLCARLEQLLVWEEVLKEIHERIQNFPRKETLDPENLEKQLEVFEKEISSFYHQFGKVLSEHFLSGFSDIFKSALLGRFRKAFEGLNNSYADLKSALLKKPIDLHLCCGCHFGPSAPPCWDAKMRMANLTNIQPFNTYKESSKQTLLVFTCGGGRGHLNAAKAIGEYTKGKYHIQVANTLEETLASTDIFKRMLLNFSQERLYNYLLRNEAFEWIKVLTSVGPFFLMLQQESIEKAIRLEVLRHNPDFLVTCFPTFNAMFLNVAKELDLPLLMVTTDLDTEIFTRGMSLRSCDMSYPKWGMTLAYDTHGMRERLEKRIPTSKIHISGFPVRLAFNLPISDVENEAIRQKFEIDINDRLLLVVIGGIAGRATEKYAMILSHLSDEEVSELTKGKLHILCLCGDQKLPENKAMRLRIDDLRPKSKQMKIHGTPAYETIAGLMSIADAMITKPGGCTTNEGLAKGLPMIFHAPFALMDWEVSNMDFCIQEKMGARFKLRSTTSLFQDGIAKNKEILFPLIKAAFSRRKKAPSNSFEKKDFGVELLQLLESFSC